MEAGEEEKEREESICGSVNRGKDAPAGWMLLLAFLSSKREPEEGTNEARVRARA